MASDISKNQASKNKASHNTVTKSANPDAAGSDDVNKPDAANSDATAPKQPCRVTVTAPGWHGAKAAAIAAGCSSISDMIEKLGRGELAIITSDAIRLDPLNNASTQSFTPPASTNNGAPQVIPQHVHYHTTTAPPAENNVDNDDDGFSSEKESSSLPRLVITGLCATVIVGSLLYIADQFITITANVFSGREKIEDIVTPLTGDVVAGYTVSDEYGIRPFHPVTGVPNVPHNGVDLAMAVGTPIHAVGKVGDRVEVKCWWDIDGGGQVVNQTAESYPGYTFQSLHMSETGCKEGEATAGDVIAYSGNTGLGTGAHYDFRVKIDGSYVPPATKYLEAAVTGEPPKE